MQQTLKDVIYQHDLRGLELGFCDALVSLPKDLSVGKIWENSTTVRATWLWFWSSMKTFSSLLAVTLEAQKGSADRV